MVASSYRRAITGLRSPPSWQVDSSESNFDRGPVRGDQSLAGDPGHRPELIPSGCGGMIPPGVRAQAAPVLRWGSRAVHLAPPAPHPAHRAILGKVRGPLPGGPDRIPRGAAECAPSHQGSLPVRDTGCRERRVATEWPRAPVGGPEGEGTTSGPPPPACPGGAGSWAASPAFLGLEFQSGEPPHRAAEAVKRRLTVLSWNDGVPGAVVHQLCTRVQLEHQQIEGLFVFVITLLYALLQEK